MTTDRDSIPLVGVPYDLNYRSNRVRGRKTAYSLQIPLSDSTLPNSVLRIELNLTIAGRQFSQTFPAQQNLGTTFAWDGNDAYGRPIQGQQEATVDVGYVYQGAYEFNPKLAITETARSLPVTRPEPN